MIYVSGSLDVSRDHNDFSNNFVPMGGGGAVFWETNYMEEPGNLSSNNFSGNFAPYGPDVATNSVQWIYEDSVRKISGVESEESDTYSLYLTSFNNVITFSVNFKDSYGQIVTSQQTFISASVNELGSSCGGQVPYIAGKTVAESSQPRWR